MDYARARIRQKKRLYFHFVSFLFVSLVLTILNIGLGYGVDIKPFGYPWVLVLPCCGLFFAIAFFSSLCDQAIYESCLGKTTNQKFSRFARSTY
ncbi:MAG: hypothetical protein CM15mP59_1370 [Flavobacteriaceae bacterium]|nr:MAG: hypothetical protein CM15mP59_1370 [Flavobacteriaceae bacterium]